MRSQALTLVLLVVLGFSTVALGLTFGGGFSQAPINVGPRASGSSNLNPSHQPVFIVKAQTVANDFIIASSGLTEIPSYMFTPIPNVQVVLIGSESPAVARRGLIPNFRLLTNSSGLGEITVPRGNFTVTASGAVFNFSTSVKFQAGVVTDVILSVIPEVGKVSSLVVANQDTIQGAEPNATIYASIQGRLFASPSTSFVLSGALPQASGLPGQSSQNLTVDLVVIGSYATPQGTMVVLKHQGPLGLLPLAGDTLLQYRTNSTVSYLAS